MAIGASIGFFIGAILNYFSLIPEQYALLSNIALMAVGYLLAFNGRLEKA